MANNSRWISFTTVRNESWRHENVVLLGDAAHTAHFSIGSGTKLAMEDALALAACLHERSTDARRRALAAYEDERRPVVLSTQRAAQASLEWFENLGQYVDQEPAAVRVQHHDPQPAGHLRQPAAARPRVRRPGSTRWFARARAATPARERRRPAADVPAASGCASSTLVNRVVVSPMDMYCAVDGVAERLPPRRTSAARRSAAPGW